MPDKCTFAGHCQFHNSLGCGVNRHFVIANRCSQAKASHIKSYCFVKCMFLSQSWLKLSSLSTPPTAWDSIRWQDIDKKAHKRAHSIKEACTLCCMHAPHEQPDVPHVQGTLEQPDQHVHVHQHVHVPMYS
jgi:hypothetical protein